jgi:hypothetical protein
MAKKMMGGKLPVQQILGVVAGSVAAGLVGKAVTKFLPNSSDTVKALIPIAAGVFLAMQKNEIMKGAGFGMVAAGGSSLVEAFVPGIKGTDVDDLFLGEADDYLSLPADQSILSLPADQSILSGIDMDDDSINGDLDYMDGADEDFNY